MKEEERICGDCIYFELTTYPFIGKGICTNQKNTFCYKRRWSDDGICENYTAEARGEE